jgi:GNAT superfamily N-acetyltransferase
MSVTVRPAALTDWSPGLQPLLAGMGSFVDGGTARERFERIAGSADHILAVAAEGDALVGYAWAHDYGPHLRSGSRLARLNDLYVDPARRKRGHGRRLFMYVREWARSRGVRWLQWQAGRGATGFYERLGLRGDPCPDPEHPEFEIDFAPDPAPARP